MKTVPADPLRELMVALSAPEGWMGLDEITQCEQALQQEGAGAQDVPPEVLAVWRLSLAGMACRWTGATPPGGAAVTGVEAAHLSSVVDAWRVRMAAHLAQMGCLGVVATAPEAQGDPGPGDDG